MMGWPATSKSGCASQLDGFWTQAQPAGEYLGNVERERAETSASGRAADLWLVSYNGAGPGAEKRTRMTALVEGAWPGALARKGTWRLMASERRYAGRRSGGFSRRLSQGGPGARAAWRGQLGTALWWRRVPGSVASAQGVVRAAQEQAAHRPRPGPPGPIGLAAAHRGAVPVSGMWHVALTIEM